MMFITCDIICKICSGDRCAIQFARFYVWVYRGNLKLTKRLPSMGQIAPVYAVIVMMTYGWTIVWFFWQIPSWIKYLSLLDVLGIFSYAMTVNLLESLTALMFLAGLSAILPEKWFRASFVSRGSSLVLLFGGCLMYYSNSFTTVLEKDFPQQFVSLLPIILVVIVFLLVLIDRLTFLRNFVEDFASRAVVFLYISIPISVLAFLYVIVRNLFWRFINA